MVGHRSKGTGTREMNGPPGTNSPCSCYFVRADGQDKYRSTRRGGVCNIRIQVQQNTCMKQEKIKD
jgi:hypothetical protein